ncbi:MAG: NADP-dependent isocitrate dehydrogenase [Microthrixaceae bacterium]
MTTPAPRCWARPPGRRAACWRRVAPVAQGQRARQPGQPLLPRRAYWARALARPGHTDPELAARFEPIAQALEGAEQAIVDELAAVQGSPVDLGGYYFTDPALVDEVMRPSTTLNEIIAGIGT